VNGERRSFALLRPIDDVAAQAGLRDLILEAYVEFEASTVRHLRFFELVVLADIKVAH
jgi:hypothetical protein